MKKISKLKPFIVDEGARSLYGINTTVSLILILGQEVEKIIKKQNEIIERINLK